MTRRSFLRACFAFAGAMVLPAAKVASVEPIFRRTKITWVPKLDNDDTVPVYLINWYVLPTRYNIPAKWLPTSREGAST